MAEMTSQLGRIQAAIVTDYRGLTVEEITRLRRRLRPLGGSFTVVKNTLLKRAMASQGMPDLGDLLEGPSAILFAEGDAVVLTKEMQAFTKELRRDLPIVKGGFMGQSLLSKADVAMLATLPSKREIQGNLVGTIQAPVSNLVGVVGAMLQNLVGTIEAYAQKMEAA
jgi:large subunit ribosomal protein L10